MAGRTDVSAWLRSETPHHLELLTKLRVRLVKAMDAQFGHGDIVPADTNDRGTMSRDWTRAYGRYQAGFNALLVEERERAKLALMAHRTGQTPLTDEEYERDMRELGIEALKELPTADLAIEMANRGLTMPVVSDLHDPD